MKGIDTIPKRPAIQASGDGVGRESSKSQAQNWGIHDSGDVGRTNGKGEWGMRVTS